MKISVITPSYNSGDYIERAIKSVMAQDYHEWEHIVVDGGSTDNTLEILKHYPHLIWTSEPDKGQADAMNKGFSRSSGDIIVYLNADDYFFDGAFRAVMKEFSKGAKFVVGNILIKSERLNAEFPNIPRVTLEGMLRHWEPNAFCHNPVGYFYARDVQEACPFNAANDATMDLEFLLDAAAKYRFAKVEHTLGCYMDSLNTKTHVTQTWYDYWQPKTFPYIAKHARNTFSQEALQRFETDRRAGYAFCQAMTNQRRKSERIEPVPEACQQAVAVALQTRDEGERHLKTLLESAYPQGVDRVTLLLITGSEKSGAARQPAEIFSGTCPPRLEVLPMPAKSSFKEIVKRVLESVDDGYVFIAGAGFTLKSGALLSLLDVACQTSAEIVGCGLDDEKARHDVACAGGEEALRCLLEGLIAPQPWNRLYAVAFLKRIAGELLTNDAVAMLQLLNKSTNYTSISDVLVKNASAAMPDTEISLEENVVLWKELAAFAHNEKLAAAYNQDLLRRLIEKFGPVASNGYAGETFSGIMQNLSKQSMDLLDYYSLFLLNALFQATPGTVEKSAFTEGAQARHPGWAFPQKLWKIKDLPPHEILRKIKNKLKK